MEPLVPDPLNPDGADIVAGADGAAELAAPAVLAASAGPQAAQQATEDAADFRLELLPLVLIALSGVSLWLAEERGLFHDVAANLLASSIVGIVLLVGYGRLFRRKGQLETRAQRRLLETAVTTIERVDARAVVDDTLVARGVERALASHLPIVEVAQQLGLTNFRRDRPTALINQAVLEARHTVNILEISLHTMRDITTAQWRGCKAADMRFILLDPMYPEGAPLALQRDSEEDQKHGKIREEVREFLQQIPKEWLSDEGGRPRVKLAKAMPTLSYFRIDDVAYFSPLLHKRVGDATLHLELAEGGQFFEVLAKHFEALWRDREHVVAARRDSVPPAYPDAGRAHY